MVTPTPADPRPPEGADREAVADSVTLLRSRADYAAEYGPPTLASFLRRVADMIEQERAAALRAAPARAHPDTARLDWMIANRAAVVSSVWRADRPIGDEEVTVEWLRCGDDVRRVTRRPDGRAAIDAAMRVATDRARAAAGEAGHG